jgi:polysaccharide biosynthesis transport protein
VNTPLLPGPGPEYPPLGPQEEPGVSRSALRLRRFLTFLPKYWWIPVLTLLIGIILEAAYVHFKTPVFYSEGIMWQSVKLRLPGSDYLTDDSQDYAATLNGVLRSDTLREQALELLKASTNAASIILGKDGRPETVEVSVSGEARGSLYGIRAAGSNPWYTQTYLDALMEAYLQYVKTVRNQVSGDTLDSLSDQMQRYERELKSEQDTLLAFERTNNLAILQGEASVAGTYLTTLKTQLSDLQLQDRLLNDATNSQDPGTNATLAVTADMTTLLPQGTTTPQQQSLNELEMLKIQRARLSKYLRPKHPKMVKLDEEIARAEQMQQVYQRENRDQLNAERQANHVKSQNVEMSIQEWEAKVVKANAKLTEADGIKVNIQRAQNVYDQLASLVQNLSINRDMDQGTLTILQHATPTKRSYSSEKQGLVLAILGGLGCGLGMVFLIAVRDDRFTSVADVNTTLGDTVVGLLPEVGRNGENAMPLLEVNDPRHIYAESYRSLRSALLFLNTEGERPKVLLVTSAMPGEGKSTVAANLARMLALSGSRVLLVDGDLRKGHLHHLLGLQREPGLVELLNHTCALERVTQQDSLPNLTFIACGAAPSGNPGDLFLGSGLDQILARWRAEYDYVVMDSSPLFATADAGCLAPKADGALFVVRNRRSGARAAREALDLLAQRQARLLGVVFNGADTSARSYYYYKYSDYHPAAKPG